MRSNSTLGFLLVIGMVGAGSGGKVWAGNSLGPSSGQGTSEVTSAPDQQRVTAAYGKLPLQFQVNQGQTAQPVRFLSRGSGYSLFLTPTQAVLSLRKQFLRLKPGSVLPNPSTVKHLPTNTTVVSMSLLGANPRPQIAGSEELPGKVNYFIGSDPKKWRTNISTYGKVLYKNVYPGVDLVYYGSQGQLEYDFVVSPGGNPSTIHFHIGGANRVRTDREGNLALQAAGGEVKWRRPLLYQQTPSGRHQVEGRYLLEGRKEIGFRIGKYDRRLPLIIDPVLAYSTYLGGNSSDYAYGIAVDSSGSAYLTGTTSSSNFPTQNPYQAAHAADSGSTDAFVSKLNASGNALVYSTYFGGNGSDQGRAIAVDSSGSAYITGYTQSSNFPTQNPYQVAHGTGAGPDAFVTRLNASGNGLIYSTYLGGNGDDLGYGIAVDNSGSAYITGETLSTNFPTMNPYQAANGAGFDAFVSKLSATGTTLIYSTYLGGNGNDSGYGIAVDSLGSAYLTGNTSSTNFPTMNPYQPAPGGSLDAFVTKLSAGGNTLVYSTYLGGSNDDRSSGIAVDSSGSAYITGYTLSINFPTMNPYQAAHAADSGNYDAFVSKLSAGGNTLAYSTYLGGNGDDESYGIALDNSGSAYVTGFTGSTNFPTLNPYQAINGGGLDVFIARFSAGGNSLTSSTYFGGNADDSSNGIAVDSSGSGYITGETLSTNFPTLNPYQAANSGASDAFVTKMSSANWIVTDLAVGSDGQARLLWVRNDGAIAVWSVDTAFHFTSSPAYGPYPGYNARAIACGADGLTRVLWNKSDGTAVLWLLDSNNAYQTSFGFGPYPGWTAVDITVGTDNQARILWRNADGTMIIWSVDNSGNASYGPVYGPYPGATVQRLASGADTLTRTLWSGSGNQAILWLLGQTAPYNNVYETSFGYGPYLGWSVLDVTVGVDNQARFLWSNVDGTMTLWSVDNSGTASYGPGYGPYPGFTPRAISSGGGLSWVLWNGVNGSQVVWLMGQTGGYNNVYEASAGFGPY